VKAYLIILLVDGAAFNVPDDGPINEIIVRGVMMAGFPLTAPVNEMPIIVSRAYER
jgi:hypothetical protein